MIFKKCKTMKPEIKERIAQIRRGAVPSGYRKAAVGIIPSDWTQASVGEVCEINPSRSKTPDSVVTFLGMADVSEDGRILNAKTTDYAKVSKGFTPFLRGDILVAKITPCFENGKGADTSELPTAQGFGSTEFHVLRSKICSKFVFYHTSSYEFRKKLETEMSGSAGQKRVQTDSIASYLLPLPPLEEQRRIAEILTTQDKIIALKERRLAEKRRQKTFLAQRLLTGKTRLPGFDGEWKTERLGALFAERVETKREDLELLAITASQGVIPRSRLDLKDNSSEDKSKYLRVCVGDIGYNTMRMWQGVSAYSNYEGIVSPAYTVLKPSADVCAKYFAYLFKTPKIVFLFYRHSQGLVDDTRNLKYANFKKISVVYPPHLEEQQAIAEVLTCADREIEALQRDLELEKRKKKALMQLLLTGVVRVNSRRRSA
ncbi:MAG: restriction endonuclease subunit S [Thermoguttaceae bacterium]|nr:restriction endonuclease subunit S [Thermoguttaceae bacterium]